MKAVLINPFQKSITIIEGDFNSLAVLYETLKCETIDVTPLGDGVHSIVVDDEGLFVPVAEQAFFACRAGILAGRALVVATDDVGDFCEPDIGAVLNHLNAMLGWVPHASGSAYAAQFQ